MKHNHFAIPLLLGISLLAGLFGVMPPKSSGLIKAQAANLPAPPAGSNWVQTFGDDFNGTALNRSIWRSDIPNGGNGEMQEYVNDDSMGNYQVANGVLSIVARKQSYGGRNYTSGVILSRYAFKQLYGYFEMRARVPKGQGLWPAFWLLPDSDNWVPEIDVLELLGNQPNLAYMTYHYYNSSGVYSHNQSQYTGPDFSADWHTYAVDWQPSAMVWYIDGVERKRISDPSIIPNMPLYILANLAVGGSWPGSPDGSTVFPANFDLDYIRVWQKSSSPVSTTTPAPTSAPTTAPTAGPTSAPTSGPTSVPVTTGNMINNPSFEDAAASPWNSPWNYRNDLGAAFAQDTTTAANSTRASIKISLASSNASQPWIVSVTQPGKALAAGQAYTISFWARASANRPIRAVVQEQNSPYTEYTNQTANLTGSWTRYSYTFTSPASTASALLNFNLADATGSVWIDDVAMCTAGSACSSSGSTAPTPTQTATPTQGVVNPTPTAPFPAVQDTTPPGVTLTSPQDGSTMKRRSAVTITANASDNVGVSKVEFRVNGALTCTEVAAPYTCTWTMPGSVGTSYKLEARAYDLSQNTSLTTVTVISRR